MPRTSKGARLVWREESRKKDGSLRNKAGWFIRDGSTFISAGGGEKGRPGPENEQALSDYIADKYQPARERGRDPDDILIADVVSVYLADVVSTHARPHETAARLDLVLDYFGERTLSEINGKLCRDYAQSRDTESAARRQLEDLRAAINHYRKEGYATAVPAIVLPDKAITRERWLTREEAARLLWAAWTMKQSWKGRPSDRRTGRHVARFILVGLYTGTRSGAICGAAVRPTPGQGFVDLDRGVFYRRAPGARETKKRQPPVRLPSRLIAHLRRWAATDLEIKTSGRGKSQNIGRKIAHDYVVEWNGRPVTSIKKAFRSACELAGLGWYEGDGEQRRFKTDITPHILRHTAATWLMQAGVDPWEASGFLGMTPEVLVNTYGHHHPDFQSEAAEKITSKRTPKNVVRIEAKQSENTTASPHSFPTETAETNANIGKLA